MAPTASVERGGWAARTTVALARTWGREGTKVFLADLSVCRPVLHEVVGVENGEGVSDALLYGASIRRIAVSGDEPFFFAPAGTVVADAEPVLGHPRWEVLTRGFAGAGVTLLLYAPLELPGTRSLLARASEVILLAMEGETDGSDLDGADGKVTLVLGPEEELPSEPARDEGDLPSATPSEDGGGGGAAAPARDPAAEARVGDPADAAPLHDPAAAAPVRAPAGAAPVESLRSPAPQTRRPRWRRRERSSRVEMLVLVLVLVLGGALVGAYYGYLDVPWLTPYLEQLDGGGDAAPATTPPPSPERGAEGDASSTEPGTT